MDMKCRRIFYLLFLFNNVLSNFRDHLNSYEFMGKSYRNQFMATKPEEVFGIQLIGPWDHVR